MLHRTRRSALDAAAIRRQRRFYQDNESEGSAPAPSLHTESPAPVAECELDARPSGFGRRLASTALVRFGRIATAFERDDVAVAVHSRAVRLDSRNAVGWHHLGRASREVGPLQPRNIGVVGITPRPAGNLSGALAAFRCSLALEPTPDTSAALSMVLLQSNEVEAAVRSARSSVELFPDEPAPHKALARCVAEQGRRRGGLFPNEVDEITASWGRARELAAPASDAEADFHLRGHAIRFRDWQTAYATAGGGVSDSTSVDDVLAELEALDAMNSNQTRTAAWWFVGSWHLRAAGYVTAAHSARLREAQIQASGTLPTIPTLDSIRRRVPALVHLSRLHDAAELIKRSRRIPDPSGQLDRLAADIALRLGDPTPLIAFAAEHFTGLPAQPERRFRELIAGRRVGIVGPNADTETRQRMQQSCDVLIDTKLLPSTDLKSGSGAITPSSVCDRISYYADTSTALFEAEIGSMLDDGRLQLAVIRPTTIARWQRGHTDDRVRIMPAEDSLSPGGSHFGIPRIVYDVLRVAPASVRLAAVDMFTASTPYPAAYQADDAVYAASGFVNVLDGFNHDYADDHMMLSALWKTGLVDADAATSRILELDLRSYLRMLDRAPVSGQRQEGS